MLTLDTSKHGNTSMATKKIRPEFLANQASVTLITVDEVAHMLAVSRCTVWRRVKDKNFPQPIKIGARSTRWQYEEVSTWINAKYVANDAYVSAVAA